MTDEQNTGLITGPQSLFSINREAPEFVTRRELQQAYEPQVPGVLERIGTAFTYETVTGELARDWFGPSFTPDPAFELTDEMAEKYMADFSPEIRQNIIDDEPLSFLEFLHEVDDVRTALRKRQEMFSGGGLGAAVGFGAVMFGSGSEAVALGLGAGIAGTAVGGPVGSVLAGTATTAARFRRIRGALRAGVASLTIDVPLELVRKEADKSLTNTDLLIALGASGALGGGIGAAFPGLTGLKAPLNKAIKDSVNEEAASVAAKAGDTEGASALSRRDNRVRVLSDDEIADDTIKLSDKALDAEARRLGIAGRTRYKKKKGDERRAAKEDLRVAVMEARRAEAPTPTEAVNALVESVGKMKSIDELRVVAKKLGLAVDQTDTVKGLRNRIVQEARRQGQTGTRRVRRKMARIPVKVGSTISKVVDGKRIKFKLAFATNAEKALWKLGGNVTKKTDMVERDRLISALEEMGIENPEELGKQLRKAAKELDVYKQGVKGGTLDIDAESMLGRTMGDYEEVPIRMLLDKKTGTVAVGPRGMMKGEPKPDTPKGKKKAESDPHPLADTDDDILVIDGREVARGPGLGGSRIIDIEEDDLVAVIKKAAAQGRRTVGGAKSKREKAALLADGTVGMPLGPIGRWLNNIFTPAHSRLVRMEGESDVHRLIADMFLEGRTGSAVNVYSIVRENTENMITELNQSLFAARRKFVESGGTKGDFDKAVVRALTSGDEVFDNEAIAQGVKGLRTFYGKILNYAQKNGMLSDNVPDPKTFFKRVYKPTGFSEMINRLGGGAKGRANLKKLVFLSLESAATKAGVKFNEKAAKIAADNIVGFGTNPKNYRDLKSTLKNIDDLRSKIAAEAEEAGLDESVVDDILSAVVGQSEEPHLRGFQKHRYELDENFETTIDGVAVHIDDLFNRDIAAVTSAYAHQVFGATEMRKALKALARETGDSSWENVGVNTFAAQAAKGIDNTADREYAEKAFEMAYRRVSGMRLWEASEGTLKFVIGTQSFAQGIYGQALGIAQLPEIASNLVKPGFRNSLTALPAIKDIANIFLMGLRGEKPLRGESGRLLDNVAAELETFVGCGGDYIRGEHVLRRLDDMGIDKGSTSIFGKALDMGRSVALLNPLGVIPMDTFLRRWGTKAYFQKFVNEAYRMKEGKPVLQQSFWNNGKQRFMELGLSEQEATRIFKALASDDVVTVKKGLFGNYKVMDIDFDKIGDQHAYDMLALAIRKGVDMSVQRQSLGEMPLWMNKGPVVKMFTQYRVFMMASRGKQVAAGIARADAKEAANLIGSIGLGALGYTLLTYGRSFSRPEEERAAYFEEQLSSSNMLKSGIMRSSYSSIFPMLIDSGFSWAGHTAPFGASKRTTGFGTGVFDGTVPGGVLKQILGVSGEIGANMFSEDEWTTKDIRDITRLLWFTRVPVVSQAMDSLVSNYTGLPDRD
tara:strand:+ start:3666 stop:7976 length:4311 start_codon:yes stop_codon:yes gene_type:complete